MFIYFTSFIYNGLFRNAYILMVPKQLDVVLIVYS